MELERHGGLSVRPPASCSQGTDEWLNPEVPIEEGIYDESGGEEFEDVEIPEEIPDEAMIAEGPADEGEVEEPEEPEPPPQPEPPPAPVPE